MSFIKDKFAFDLEKNIYMILMGQILENQRTLKNKPRFIYWTNNCKNAQNMMNAVEKAVIDQ